MRRSPVSDRPPLEVGAAVKGGAWAVARYEGAGRRMLRYLAMGRAGRRAELKEYFPAGWRRTPIGYEPLENESSEREIAAFARQGFEIAQDLPSHPNQARTLEVFEDSGTFFVIQEWLEGESLEARVQRSGPLPLDEARSAIAQAGSGLAALHGLGRLHRDVSPGNVLLVPGRALIFDYELLTPFPEVRKLGTKVLANPAYAPLELLSVFPRYGPESDVYGLAATLYFALGGKPAPPAARRTTAPKLPPLPRIPEPVMAAISRAMAVRAKDRTPTVAAFLEEVAEV